VIRSVTDLLARSRWLRTSTFGCSTSGTISTNSSGVDERKVRNIEGLTSYAADDTIMCSSRVATGDDAGAIVAGPGRLSTITTDHHSTAVLPEVRAEDCRWRCGGDGHDDAPPA